MIYGMESLREPDNNFDFEKLVLTSPVNVNGGNYFIKYLYDKCPLYVKAPTCRVKQGIVTTSKRIFCDLMFTNENEEFIQYLENLEQYSQKYIYQNRDKWFETELEENDIENSFNSCIKIFKSGKFYCLRVSVPRILGKSNLKIYDENEQLVKIEDIKENDKVTTALEIQGIKCSPRSFQIEIEIKQMLLMNDKNIFEKCVLLKKEGQVLNQNTLAKIETVDVIPQEVPNDEEVSNEEHVTNEIAESNDEEDVTNEIVEPIVEEDQSSNTIVIPNDEEVAQSNEDNSDKIEEPLEMVELKLEDDEPTEFEIPLEQVDENTISLKKKSDVYYEMYRKALNKAKMAKDLALASFLEAKQIKNTYMLDDIEDDSDLDDSISLESE